MSPPPRPRRTPWPRWSVRSRRPPRRRGRAPRLALAFVLTGASAVPATAQDEVSVEARLGSERIGVGESTVLEVTIRTPGGEPDAVRVPPLTGGLAVSGTRQTQQYQLSIPGGRTRVIRREIYLSARREGRYAIPPVVVIYDGRRYTTRALTLEVGPAPSTLAVPDGTAAPDGEVVLRTIIEPDTVFVGEQVTLRSDALFADEVRGRMRRSPEYLAPAPSGLWIYDLPDVRSARTEWIGQRRYEVHTFRRAYFPIEPGVFDIPSARLVYEVRRGFLFTPDTEELETRPIDLVVRPLPDSAVPDAFTGAVGRFTLEAWLGPDSVAVGDASILTVRVAGSGNVKALPAPRLPRAGVRFESPGEEADFSGTGGRISGTKTFRWVVVPERPGTVRLGPIEYAYFDPAIEQYVVIRSDSLTLEVAPGASVATASGAGPSRSLRPLELAPDPPARAPAAGWLALLALAPYVLVGGLLWGQTRWRRRERVPSRRRLRKRLRNRMAALRSSDDLPVREFSDALRKEARTWMAERGGRLALARVRGRALARELVAAGASDALAARVADLLDTAARAPFQPRRMSPADRRRLVDRVEEALLQLDRTLPRRARGGARTSAIGLPILLAVTAMMASAMAEPIPAPAAAVEQVPSGAGGDGRASFREGVRFFEAGQPDEAATAFARYTRERPEDAAGWYNLGTVHASRGRTGPAVGALLTAVRLDPSDGATLHNLDVLDVDEEWIAAARPWPPLRAGTFTWLVLGLAWAGALLFAVLGLRLRTVRHPALLAAALPLLVAGGLLAARHIDLRASPAVTLRRAPLRAAPENRAPALSTPEEGTVGWRVDDRGAWVRLRIPGGDDGWIEAADVEVIGGEVRLSAQAHGG